MNQAERKGRGGKDTDCCMDNSMGAFFIIGILILVLMMGALKNRGEWIVNFLLRGVLGMMSIYFGNILLANAAPGMALGYNLITFLTSGILGFPGVAMLYGINFYMLL